MNEQGELVLSQRELIEYILVTKQNNEALVRLVRMLEGNGKPGLCQEMEELKFKVKILIGAVLLVSTPVVGVVVSFIIGLLINRVEVIIH